MKTKPAAKKISVKKTVATPVITAHDFSLTFKQVSEIVNRTAFAMSKEYTRYYMQGVCFDHEAKTNTLTCVSTDGHRMSVVKLSLLDQPHDFSFIASADCINFLLRAVNKRKDLKKMNAPVNFSLSADHKTLTISHDGQTITMKNVDGTYPDYKRVIPNYKKEISLSFNADYMAQACKAAKAKGGKRVRLSLDGAGGHEANPMRITANTIKNSDIMSHDIVIMPMRNL